MADCHQRTGRLVGGKRTVKLGQGRLGALQHIALVGGIGAPQKLTRLGNESRLEGGGTGVDAQERHTAVVFQGGAAHLFLVVAGLEPGIALLVGKKRRQAHHFRALHVAQVLQPLQHIRQPLHLGAGRSSGQGATAGHEQVRVIGHDNGLVGKPQGFVEPLAQLGQILQRTAQKRHVSPDGAPAGKAGDGLGYH